MNAVDVFGTAIKITQLPEGFRADWYLLGKNGSCLDSRGKWHTLARAVQSIAETIEGA